MVIIFQDMILQIDQMCWSFIRLNLVLWLSPRHSPMSGELAVIRRWRSKVHWCQYFIKTWASKRLNMPELYSFEPGLMIPKTCSTLSGKLAMITRRWTCEPSFMVPIFHQDMSTQQIKGVGVIFVCVISKLFPGVHILMSAKLVIKGR